MFAQITGAVWIAGCSLLKFIRVPESIEIKDVIISGIGIVACFFPVTISVVMDKIKDIKIGEAE